MQNLVFPHLARDLHSIRQGAAAPPETSGVSEMTTTIPTEPKPDNLLGICAALGEDFGFNPLWLRVALGAGILWNPAVIVGTYLALGLVVLATRLAFPDRKPSAGDVPGLALVPAASNTQEPELALAA